MDLIASAVDGVKSFVRSGQEFVKGALQPLIDRRRFSPIESLKCLQHEAFTDLMNSRDRQDEFEHIIFSSESRKGGTFREDGTHMKGVFSFGGAFLSHDDEQAYSTLDILGIRTDISAKFTFRTSHRQKDSSVAEFLTDCNKIYDSSQLYGSPLVLSKLSYTANINDSLSAIIIPFGATCTDFQFNSDFMQGPKPTGLSFSRPPFFNQVHACATGLTIKTSKFAAALAELASSSVSSMSPAVRNNILSSFGEICSQLSGETKLTLSGAWQIPASFSMPISVGKITKSMSTSQPHSVPDEIKHTYHDTERKWGSNGGSVSLFVDLDESTKFGGWVEVQKSSPEYLKWVISVSEMPDNETGWGIVMGGSHEGNSVLPMFGGFLSFSVGKTAMFQPGLVFTKNKRGRAPTLMLHSSWSV